MTHDLASLQAAFRAKERLQYLLFWGHQPQKNGQLSASCFSQWWPAPFTVDGTRYSTAEHWMMEKKSRLFDDLETARRIVEATTPKRAKELGREIKGFVESAWSADKRSIVFEGNFHKFDQNPALRDFLLSTGDAVLVEASPVDRIWGIGLAADSEHAENPLQWRGENLLGFVLMDVRQKLRGQATSDTQNKS